MKNFFRKNPIAGVAASLALICIVTMGAASGIFQAGGDLTGTWNSQTINTVTGATKTDDTVLVGNGTVWQSKAIADCDDTGGNHLNYDTGTNAFSCGTSGAGGGGVTQTTDTFEITWPTACTTTPSQTWNYTKTGNTVTLRMVDDVICTSDSTNFLSAAGDVPAAIRPANLAIMGPFRLTDNGTTSERGGCLSIDSDGSARIYFTRSAVALCAPNQFTASGEKRVEGAASATGPNSWTYTLD